jgi:hypothetical protein
MSMNRQWDESATFTNWLRNLPSGTIIPKPSGTSEFRVKGIGMRSREDALVYRVPNRQNPSQPHEKGITMSEFQAAYIKIASDGVFTKVRFDQNLMRCSREGSCNFTTIGGLLCEFGVAAYDARGTYRKDSRELPVQS